MDWRDILIHQAITTLIVIVRETQTRKRFSRQIVKVFQVIAEQMASDADVQRIMKENVK
jgi:hypothetical protein